MRHSSWARAARSMIQKPEKKMLAKKWRRAVESQLSRWNWKRRARRSMGMERRAKEYQSASEGRMASRQGTCWARWRFVANERAMAVQKRMKTGQRILLVAMIGRSTRCASGALPPKGGTTYGVAARPICAFVGGLNRL